MSNKTQLMMDIRSYEKDIDHKKDRIAQLKEDIEVKIENTDAGERVGKLRDQLKLAQEDLVAELKRNPEVNNLMEEIVAEKDVLKGMQMALSDHLIAYFAETKERQVQMDEQGHAKDVLITAKLSKKEHKYQTSIFSENAEVEISDGKSSIKIGGKKNAK